MEANNSNWYNFTNDHSIENQNSCLYPPMDYSSMPNMQQSSSALIPPLSHSKHPTMNELNLMIENQTLRLANKECIDYINHQRKMYEDHTSKMRQMYDILIKYCGETNKEKQQLTESLFETMHIFETHPDTCKNMLKESDHKVRNNINRLKEAGEFQKLILSFGRNFP